MTTNTEPTTAPRPRPGRTRASADTTDRPWRAARWGAVACAMAYVLVLAGANVLTSRYGLIPAGLGLSVTAGTYAAGLALALRDTLQNLAGLPVAVAAMAVGIAVSAATADPRIVVASTAATGLAELTDLALYTPLRRRGQRRALLVSCAISAIADTVIFLHLAGFPLTPDSLGGQLLVKAVWATGSYLLLREGVLRVVSRQRQHTRHPRRDAGR